MQNAFTSGKNGPTFCWLAGSFETAGGVSANKEFRVHSDQIGGGKRLGELDSGNRQWLLYLLSSLVFASLEKEEKSVSKTGPWPTVVSETKPTVPVLPKNSKHLKIWFLKPFDSRTSSDHLKRFKIKDYSVSSGGPALDTLVQAKPDFLIDSVICSFSSLPLLLAPLWDPNIGKFWY